MEEEMGKWRVGGRHGLREGGRERGGVCQVPRVKAFVHGTAWVEIFFVYTYLSWKLRRRIMLLEFKCSDTLLSLLSNGFISTLPLLTDKVRLY